MQWNRSCTWLAGALLSLCAATSSAEQTTSTELPRLNIDLKQTTVSGISSGAFMAVQFAVAKSSVVQGVAATAGGPYFCALQDSKGGANVSASIGRCMQGDPAYRVRPITTENLKEMESQAREWAKAGKIDPVVNLSKQAVWVFHGYNDGIVKLPVSNALVDWYQRFAPSSQVFHKDNLPAAHAQISASCGENKKEGESCNVCSTTGGKFINACPDPNKANGGLYDAAGVALQMFYGALQRTPLDKLSAQPQAFSQVPFLKNRDGSPVKKPESIAMDSTGYVYVPASCQAGESCRLHIAFHGCLQGRGAIGTSFVEGAGVNEWADANKIVVLYPQATATKDFGLPLNPMGCWDWWGYNDTQDNLKLGTKGGYYATANGVQIAAVWRMVEQLASAKSDQTQTSVKSTSPASKEMNLVALDQTAKQVVLRWQALPTASAYQVYRSENGGTAQAVGAATNQAFFVDGDLQANTPYAYFVVALNDTLQVGKSNTINVTTATPPPACDPYFSLTLNTTVDKPTGLQVFNPLNALGVPVKEVCK